MSSTYADIAFPTPVRRLFTYSVPAGMEVHPGMRVWVPLRNEKAIGMVIGLHDRTPSFKTKPLLRVLDRQPVLSGVMLKLIDWIHRFYYCSQGEAVQAALPSGLNFISEKRLAVNKAREGEVDSAGRELLDEVKRGLSLKDARRRWRDGWESDMLERLIRDGILEIWEQPVQKTKQKRLKHWDWADGMDSGKVEEICREAGETRWVEALKHLQQLELPLTQVELLELEEITSYTLKKLEKEGVIVARQLPVSNKLLKRYPARPERLKTLSEGQQQVCDQIVLELDRGEFHSFMLHGVTGSGKTEVYIHALKHAISSGRGGMILVPEIALTPQTVRRFREIFGERIAVIHSRLTDRERIDAWEGLLEGKKQIVIGPRSAVFAPVRNLGLIVVDEEHDSSYKQFDPAPRYHARDVAIMRAHMERAVVVMGSATPSMIAIRGVQEQKHTLLELPDRPSGALPEVHVLDMKQYRSAMRGPLAIALYEAVKSALEREEQIILLYNRRGYASYLQCDTCGEIPQSPHCSVSLTYHKKKNMLLCHYSGYARRAELQCRECGTGKMVTRGSGTQQIEDEIAELFPDARLLRMDRDTTSGKESHRRIYEQFLNRKADILIGTQLVSKGLDFPDVTVVGVLGAETELAFPSFRSGERMFQLLSQVAGRAGRSSKEGHVYIQTWKPDHRAVRYARIHDFNRFSAEELAERSSLHYPPFSRMVAFRFRGRSEAATRQVANAFTAALRQVTADSAVLGPSPGVIEWMNGRYIWETHLKINRSRNAASVEQLLDAVFAHYESSFKPVKTAPVRISVDVDAIE